jgi:hypothetical protein
VNFRKYTDKYVTVPMHEEAVSIEALLTHTSGIPNYTDMSAWQERSRSDVTLQGLIDVFGGAAFDFPPGTNWRYSNSGYVLLGAVVEAVSGMRYADFLEQRIFQPLHMAHTAYGDQSRVTAERASGYDVVNGHYVNAGFLSMTQSFSAGAILSTVDDLAAWNAGLDGHALLSDASKARMWTAFTLPDGRDTGYGYGWRVGSRDGKSVQEHGGLINGYIGHVVRLPDDHVYVAVLTNDYSRGAEPGQLAEALAVTAAGRPRVDPPAVSGLSLSGDLAGAYQGPFDQRYTVVFDNGRYGVLRNQQAVPLVPMGADAFFIAGEFNRFTFERDAARKPVRLRVRGFANETIAARTAAVPIARAAITLPEATLDRYVGVYQMAPSGSMTVRRDAGRLFERIDKQPEFEIFAEAENRFFLKTVDVQLTFQSDSSGRVTGLILHQSGRDYQGVRQR